MGAQRVMWPFGKVEISNEHVSITGLGVRCIIQKKEIRRIEWKNSYFSEGIKLIHTRPDLDTTVIFRTSHAEDFIDLVKKLGYPTISI